MDALRDTPHPVRFAKEADQTLVLLTQEDYLDLLVRSNVTDPDSWPPGKQDGAKLLERIRAIEQNCVKEHGKWDWELLSEDLQDEYDGSCIELSKLRTPEGAQPISLEDFLREEGIELSEL
jgi:hypothetical protein